MAYGNSSSGPDDCGTCNGYGQVEVGVGFDRVGGLYQDDCGDCSGTGRN